MCGTCTSVVSAVCVFICCVLFASINVYSFMFRHCGIKEPSWSELNHFVQFLNIQWTCYEQSVFCHLANVELGGKTKEEAYDNLPDLPSFVVAAMLQMSKVM